MTNWLKLTKRSKKVEATNVSILFLNRKDLTRMGEKAMEFWEIDESCVAKRNMEAFREASLVIFIEDDTGCVKTLKDTSLLTEVFEKVKDQRGAAVTKEQVSKRVQEIHNGVAAIMYASGFNLWKTPETKDLMSFKTFSKFFDDISKVDSVLNRPPNYYCDEKHRLICLPYSFENLDEMAQKLNIRKKNFDKCFYIIPSGREEEIKKRCVLVSSEELVDMINKANHIK